MKTMILELSGHILDSLTLAKVIDQIQLAGFDYVFNDLRVGRRKGDVSRAQFTVLAPNEEELQLLLAQLRTYGVVPLPLGPLELATVHTAGQVPPAAYIRQNPPLEILLNGEWQSIEPLEVTVIVPLDGTPRLCPIRDVRPGDQVVIGNQGLRAANIAEA